MPGIMHPTVNLNGTSKDELRAQASAAVTAVRNAIEALQAAGPNGRDYQLGPGTYAIARDQHAARWNALNNVLSELSEIEEKLWDL